jgi:hypothetical protein
MQDTKKYEMAQKRMLGQSSNLFSESYMNDLASAKALNWLNQHNVAFVVAPTSETCYENIEYNGGVPPFFVRFITFGGSASRAVEYLSEINPLLILKEEMSSKHKLSNSYAFTVFNTLTYNQFIELVEYACDQLSELNVLIKRFKIEVDVNDTGKISYTALEKNQNFFSFLENYQGGVDLFDKSFLHYVGDLMTEYVIPKEPSNAHIRPTTTTE